MQRLRRKGTYDGLGRTLTVAQPNNSDATTQSRLFAATNPENGAVVNFCTTYTYNPDPRV